MPKFDHRFDNSIQNKEDLRFSDLDTAMDYAEAQCNSYGYAQSVIPIPEEPGLFKVIEHPSSMKQAPRNAVYFVNEII